MFYGVLNFKDPLVAEHGLKVSVKMIRCLRKLMGIQAIYPKRQTSTPDQGNKIYHYLLREVQVTRPNQVWAADLTLIPMARSFLYLVALIDWYARIVLSENWGVVQSLQKNLYRNVMTCAINHGVRSFDDLQHFWIASYRTQARYGYVVERRLSTRLGAGCSSGTNLEVPRHIGTSFWYGSDEELEIPVHCSFDRYIRGFNCSEQATITSRKCSS